jgi:hypothetical protein
MVDTVRVKSPKQGRPFANRRSGRIRAFNLRRNSWRNPAAGAAGGLFIEQPQGARLASRHRTHASGRNRKTCHAGKGTFRDKAPDLII